MVMTRTGLSKTVMAPLLNSMTIEPPDASLTMSERAELIRLREDYKTARSENAQLRMEAEFAKKVATWFANDQQ